MSPSREDGLRRRAFRQVDVFTDRPYAGNPLAVVLDGEGLSSARMQAFADWTNLSETTFLLPPESPDADYRVRIFSPGRELAFAGHPTLGTCHPRRGDRAAVRGRSDPDSSRSRPALVCRPAAGAERPAGVRGGGSNCAGTSALG